MAIEPCPDGFAIGNDTRFLIMDDDGRWSDLARTLHEAGQPVRVGLDLATGWDLSAEVDWSADGWRTLDRLLLHGDGVSRLTGIMTNNVPEGSGLYARRLLPSSVMTRQRERAAERAERKAARRGRA